MKNSFDFAEEVVSYDHNFYMASLDVESLFMNIPLKKTIKNCVNDLFSIIFYSDKLNRKDLHELLKLATTQSSFIFDNKLYKEIDGVAMGSRLGPTLANDFFTIMKKFGLMNGSQSECLNSQRCVLKGHSYLGSHIPSTHKSTPPTCGVLWAMLTGDMFDKYVPPKENKQILVGCYHLGTLQMTNVDSPIVR